VFFDRVIDRVRRAPTRRVAVAAADGAALLLGMVQARDAQLAQPLLFGDAARLRAQAAQAGLDLAALEIRNHPDPAQALAAAVDAVRSGHCEVLLKGAVPTPDFLRAVLQREGGLRGPGLLSHMAAFELDGRERPLFLTDSGLTPYPDLPGKIAILRQGIRFLHCLGYSRPKVAVLSSTESPDPRIPASADAVALERAAAGDALGAADVAGPFALDLAVSARAAAVKGVVSPVAGQADLLLCPDVVAGNILGKSLLYLAGARGAGLILGATAPVVMLSRADDAQTKLRSLALAIAADCSARGSV
jgi:phosphate butyryltransferase